MKNILYYSNYCEHSKSLLKLLSRSKIKEDLHFICIDKRIKKGNIIHILLEDGKNIYLPPNINKVPSILLINKGGIVLEGQSINDFLFPHLKKENNNATSHNGEPLSFSIQEFGNIHSDKYSYLDQTPSELSSTDGNGGLRQIHNYATIDYVDNIETPVDTYSPDKIGNLSLEELRNMRNK